MKHDIQTVLYTEADIKGKVQELGTQISHDYAGSVPILISVLKGGIVFHADLMRAISLPVEIEFMGVSSYGTTTKSSGVVKITKDCNLDLTNRDVIIVEDIVDSGLSLKYIIDILKGKNPRSLKVCVLLDKKAAHDPNIPIDYRGFDVPDDFVVGYGLDFNERYRNLPFIGILKKEIYS